MGPGGFDVGKMMKQAQEMQKKMARVQEGLKERIVDATVGGGMVAVKVNGAQEVVDVKVSDEIMTSGDKAMLEELLISAVNEGLKKSRKLMEAEMGKVTGGLNLPGLTS